MAKRKARRRKRWSWDPQKKAQVKQRRTLRSLFERLGFEHIQADGIHFKFDGRTGELDDIFIQDNVLVLCEYTIGKATSAHVAPKSILWRKIRSDVPGWIETYGARNRQFAHAITTSGYARREFQARIVYVSADGVSDELEKEYTDISFLDGTRLRYFESLSTTIFRSARHEFFKYLAIDYADLGEQVHTSKDFVQRFPGYLLPEAHSNYPSGFRVVSFYADPEFLLKVSYVLRRDSWRDGESLYQRILIKRKIAEMREYLAKEGRVFVNNIIVTLPADTQLHDPKTRRSVDPATLARAAAVSVLIPYAADKVGLVDGQHRVFCYYEGIDRLEKPVAALRKRQNLLVTGLVFPETWSEPRRHAFEAKLFLEINDKQARAKSGLKQSIELILNPYSEIAIAKEITNQLARRGPLAGLLQAGFFDLPEKIKTTSIVSYGLKPLVKLDGDDSLFTAWRNPGKKQLADDETVTSLRRRLRDAYIEHCVEHINTFLVAAKMCSQTTKRWNVEKKRRGRFPTPTVINGLFVCLRRLVQSSKLTTQDRYEAALKGLDTFPFSQYKSSAWRALGDELYTKFFSK